MTNNTYNQAHKTKSKILTKGLVASAIIASVILLSYLFSTLGDIHGQHLSEGDYYPHGVPNILGLLDSTLFMGFIVMVTIAVAVYVLYLFWQLHEVAVHRAKAVASVHTQLVFALSLCGLFLHKAWWVLAIVIAFARWDVIGNSLSRIINNGIKGEQS
ncbi:magnesium transporter [Shewanella corallii]|uniref:Magnesium transporter n=1 Tax=Shewanella corallii TaxID=560080 RepID=A0ABT0N554_9GAMM|nr:magnesium transporter [Shewanella corallii]MCL2912937.1 magnesium transporter [Shewanella corallii]